MLLPTLGLIPALAARFAISLILPNAVFLTVYFRTEEFQMALEVVQRMTKGKLRFLKKLERKAP